MDSRTVDRPYLFIVLFFIILKKTQKSPSSVAYGNARKNLCELTSDLLFPSHADYALIQP